MGLRWLPGGDDFRRVAVWRGRRKSGTRGPRPSGRRECSALFGGDIEEAGVGEPLQPGGVAESEVRVFEAAAQFHGEPAI